MLKFINGPANSIVLGLRRAPIFLRVVVNRYGEEKKWDALDQLTDKPASGEDIYAYRQTRYDGMVHLRRSKPGTSGFFAMGEYTFVDEQPDDATIRDNVKWQTWCIEQVRKETEKPTDEPQDHVQ